MTQIVTSSKGGGRGYPSLDLSRKKRLNTSPRMIYKTIQNSGYSLDRHGFTPKPSHTWHETRDGSIPRQMFHLSADIDIGTITCCYPMSCCGKFIHKGCFRLKETHTITTKCGHCRHKDGYESPAKITSGLTRNYQTPKAAPTVPTVWSSVIPEHQMVTPLVVIGCSKLITSKFSYRLKVSQQLRGYYII